MPYRMVLSVFKTIAMAMLFVFIADMAIYLYKAFQLQQRMENIGVSMQRVVMENDYLPKSEYDMYQALFAEVKDVMNGEKVAKDANGVDSGMDFGGTNFIDGDISLNYNNRGRANDRTPSSLGGSDRTIYVNSEDRYADLSVPAEYGDLKYIEMSVTINQPMWGFNGRRDAASGLKSNAWGRITNTPSVTLYFSYLVPCLHYNAITGTTS